MNLVECDRMRMSNFDLQQQLSRPLACVGCRNYHGGRYGNQRLVCGIRPYGYSQLTNCPDFVASFAEMHSIVEIIKQIQPSVEILQQSDQKITLKGKFVSRTGTDDIEYLTQLRLMSASWLEGEERRTYVLPR